MNVSNRGIALVYQGQQGSLIKSMLTVESYIKWYSIFVVSSDGMVSILPDKVYERYEKENPKLISWSDHKPVKEFCLWIEDNYPEYDWDEPSLDMIWGRWEREI